MPDPGDRAPVTAARAQDPEVCKAAVALAQRDERIAVLEAALEEALARVCPDCGRWLHPKSVTCDGCNLDDLRARAGERRL